SSKTSGNSLADRIFCSGFPFACLLRLSSRIYVRFGVKFRLHVVLPARRLEVEFSDHEFKNKVIQQEINDSHRNNSHPTGLFVSLKDTKQEKVQKAAGKGQAYRDIQYMGDHIGASRQNHLYR